MIPLLIDSSVPTSMRCCGMIGRPNKHRDANGRDGAKRTPIGNKSDMNAGMIILIVIGDHHGIERLPIRLSNSIPAMVAATAPLHF
jgi:hypothetical protein